MGKKIKVRLTEQELIDLITKQITGQDSMDILKDILSKGENKTIDKTSDTPIISDEGGFTKLDLNTSEGFNAYKNISDKFIQGKSSNLLNINGNMLANAAKNSFNKFISLKS